MQKWWKWVILVGFFSVFYMPMRAEAIYRSDTDTYANVLDYIEQNRRTNRENRLTDEQLQLMEDAKAMTANLHRPIDPSKPRPMAIEGDDMYYDQATGDIYARGNVRVMTIDARQIESDELQGNLKREEVRSDGKTHMLQLMPGEAKITLDGYRVVYRYGKRTGKMEDGRGRINAYYVYGRRFEFYPERVIIFDGWHTRCNAKTPDYRVAGEMIEIYPENEILIYQAKFMIKNKVIATKKYHRIDISPNGQNMPKFPRAGYSNEDGFWIGQNFSFDLMRRVEIFADLKYYSKIGYRPVYGLSWSNGGNEATLQYGFYVDSNDNWIKKEPTFIYHYSHQLGKLPFNYTLSFEEGRWTRVRKNLPNITSTHTYYGITLSPHALRLGGRWDWRISSSVTYGITRESYNHSEVRGLSWGAIMIKDFGTDFTLYAGYHYSKQTTMNSLFAYGTDNYSHRFDYGASIALTPKDRLVIGRSIDTQKGETRDIDYYWFHDFHCAQLIVRRRAKRDKWNVTLEFQPW